MRSMTRRRFISNSGRSAAGTAFGAHALSAARRARAAHANDKVVLGLIGAGGRGSSVARGLAAIEGVEIKYVCDCDARRGGTITKELEKKQGSAPARVIDMRQVLDDRNVDGVVVATPEHWHALASFWACQAGKDVYVEKCPTLTVWEGRKLIEAARAYKRIVQIGTQNRSAP